MLYPVVDIGSNTVKTAVFDSENEDRFTPIFFKSHPVRLIEKRKDGQLEKEGIYTLCNVLTEYIEHCRKINADDRMRLFATASLRGLKNTQEVLETVKRITGKDIRLLSPEEEARYSFRGICAAERTDEGLMMDMGGGSTEFLSFSGGKEENVHSFPFGCIALNEMLFTHGVEYLQEYVNKELSSLPFLTGNRYPLFLSGGSAKAMIAAKKLIYGGDDRVSHQQLYTMIGDIEKGGALLRERLEALIRERLDQLPGVVFALYCVLCVTDCPTALVSRGGIREGFAREWMLEEESSASFSRIKEV